MLLLDWLKSLFPFKYPIKEIILSFIPSHHFFQRVSATLIGHLLLAITYFGSISIACMGQNSSNGEASEISQSTSELFGLKLVKTRQLENKVMLLSEKHR